MDTLGLVILCFPSLGLLPVEFQMHSIIIAYCIYLGQPCQEMPRPHLATLKGRSHIDGQMDEVPRVTQSL